jgi:hypothetical protein
MRILRIWAENGQVTLKTDKNRGYFTGRNVNIYDT